MFTCKILQYKLSKNYLNIFLYCHQSPNEVRNLVKSIFNTYTNKSSSNYTLFPTSDGGPWEAGGRF